jgi:hypothetical protein
MHTPVYAILRAKHKMILFYIILNIFHKGQIIFCIQRLFSAIVEYFPTLKNYFPEVKIYIL